MPPPPFPLMATIRSAYASVFGAPDDLLRAGGAWLLLLMALAGGTQLAALGAPPVTANTQPPGTVLFLNLLGSLCWALSLNAIVVFWHRRLLLREEAPSLAAPVDRRVLRYVGVSILLGVLIAVPFFLLVFVVSTLLAGPDGQMNLGVAPALYRLLFSLSIALVIARIHLLLPAVAIEDRTMTLARAWKLTAGYTLPLLGGIFASALPLTLVGAFIQEILTGIGGGNTLTGFVFATVTDFLQAAIVAAFMSFSYRFFTTHVAARDA